MNLLAFLSSRVRQLQMFRAQRRALRASGGAAPEISQSDWAQSLTDTRGFYLQAFRYFHRRLPQAVQDHRRYFRARRRGFGEDAFHVMWFLLFEAFRFRSFLEIGVYRGQVLSLASLLQRRAGISGQAAGISPFLPSGDSVSRYRENIPYYEDTLRNFAAFGLPAPRLLKAFSTEPPARELIASQMWDCIYIDGNHDYAVAQADWEACAPQIPPGGIIVLDDAALNTSYDPPCFATRGHPGPSRVAEEIDRAVFREVLRVGHNRAFQRWAP